jgi:hypothetical protein
MKRIGFLLALAFVIFATLQQCKKKDKCISNKLPDLLVSIDDLSLLPYDSTSVIIFKDSIGDSCCYGFLGYSEQSYYCEQFYATKPEDCKGNYRNVQEENFILFGITDTINRIRFAFGFSNIFESESKLFEIMFFRNQKNDHGVLDVYFSKSSQYCNNTILLPAVYFNILTLLNHTYYSVYEIKNTSESQFSSGEIISVFYSITQGIVGFKKADGTIWYLAN